MEEHKDPRQIPPRAMLRNLRRNMRTIQVVDSMGAELTRRGRAHSGIDLETLLLRREVLAKDEQYVGILLPPSAGGVLANAALTLDGRVGREPQLHRLIRGDGNSVSRLPAFATCLPAAR